jgi:hypothetical protein
LLREEWLHMRFANRDLTKLEARQLGACQQ